MGGRWISVLIVVLMVLGICLAQTRPGHAVLRDAGLFQVPSSYTELAFTAPASLPSKLKSKKARIKVSFGIHNVSGSSQMYHWSDHDGAIWPESSKGIRGCKRNSPRAPQRLTRR